MSYLREFEEYGRKVERPDVATLAVDLAARLGGETGNSEDDRGRFRVGELGVYLSRGMGAQAGRITVSCSLAGPRAGRVYRECGNVTWPGCTVSAEKTLDAIARDVQRKVIDAAAPVLAQCQERLGQTEARHAELLAVIETFKARFPGADVTPGEGGGQGADPWATTATVYFRGKGLSGRLNADGSFYPDRIGTIPADRVEGVISALLETGA